MRRALAAVALLGVVACGGEGRDRARSAGGSATAAPPSVDSTGMTTSTGISTGLTTGASAAALPRDSSENAPRGPGGRPTPLPMPGGAGGTTSASPDVTDVQRATDTLRGVVAVVGAEPFTRVELRRPGDPPVSLAGADAAALRRLSGVEVWVRGTRADGVRPTMAVTRFAVRSVDGVPAMDGTLASERGRWVILGSDGVRHALTNPPAALREQLGARVWVSGATPGVVASFGVITPRERGSDG